MQQPQCVGRGLRRDRGESDRPERSAEQHEIRHRILRVGGDARGVARPGDGDEHDVRAHRRERVEHAADARGLFGSAVGRAPVDERIGARGKRDVPFPSRGGRNREHRRGATRRREIDDAVGGLVAPRRHADRDVHRGGRHTTDHALEIELTQQLADARRHCDRR